MEDSRVYIFTDGAASGNPGPGGYGAILQYGKHYKEISCGFRLTTNNRMELLAVISALEALKKKGLKISIYSDSTYVVKAIRDGWLKRWVETDFKKKKNRDLWERYIQASRGQDIDFIWLKGHAGHPQNERCDRLAVEAYQNLDNALEDTGYLDSTTPECAKENSRSSSGQLL